MHLVSLYMYVYWEERRLPLGVFCPGYVSFYFESLYVGSGHTSYRMYDSLVLVRWGLGDYVVSPVYN